MSKDLLIAYGSRFSVQTYQGCPLEGSHEMANFRENCAIREIQKLASFASSLLRNTKCLVSQIFVISEDGELRN